VTYNNGGDKIACFASNCWGGRQLLLPFESPQAALIPDLYDPKDL